MLITANPAAFVLMMPTAPPFLPSDAFSPWSGTGAGIWMILLMSVGYSPQAIYSPLFLQRFARGCHMEHVENADTPTASISPTTELLSLEASLRTFTTIG
jgi:hypothetical protein